MNNKLVCPFCGEELYDNRAVSAVASRIDIYLCVNSKCGESDKLIGTKELWQALIQVRQDLEIARKAADNSREKLAAFMHDTWGNWFAYQLNNSTVENLQRWGIQSNTPYSSLSETDKDKDRKFADKIIEIIKEQIEHKEQ